MALSTALLIPGANPAAVDLKKRNPEAKAGQMQGKGAGPENSRCPGLVSSKLLEVFLAELLPTALARAAQAANGPGKWS